MTNNSLVYVHSAKCVGIEALNVTAEVNISAGIGIHLVGLADAAVKESLLRTITSMQVMGLHIPGRKIVINLAPADLRKVGSGYDLPIAIGIIVASGQRQINCLEDVMMVGELGLDGSLRYVSGALPIADMASKQGFKACIFPKESAREAAEIVGCSIYAAESLGEVLDILEGNGQEYLLRAEDRERGKGDADCDFSEIIGQESAKRAIEIACAGGHNLFMLGPPGAGKSSLAKAIPAILPAMEKEESIVTSKIYSVAGVGSHYGLIRKRPFRAPHISASVAAMIGGGSGDSILPGEVSLAHNGVLFLDEYGEAKKSVLEALRAPIEDGKTVISRLKSKVVYPSEFQLVAASNPCPCGFYGEGDKCTCTVAQRQSYLSRLSGPIMDRIDLHCWLSAISPEQIKTHKKGETSAEVAARVEYARKIQKFRFRNEEGILTNARMGNKQIEKYCQLSESSESTMFKLMENMHFSMRAYYRIIKVARTIADLEGVRNGCDVSNPPDIEPSHLIEAANYRFLDRLK